MVLCGGGARNPVLVAMLRESMPEVRILGIDALGIPCEAKEALSFAMLAAACVDGTAGNLPQATGAEGPVVLGRLVPGNALCGNM